MRTCRELGEHRERAMQLYKYSGSDAERQAIDELVAELERRRTELSAGGELRRAVQQERAVRCEFGLPLRKINRALSR